MKEYAKECLFCKKIFISRSPIAIYCCGSCKNKDWQSKNKKNYEKNCLNCNSLFNTFLKNTKFCSYSCSSIYRNKNSKNLSSCSECGKEFQRKSVKHYYCSLECKRIANKRNYKKDEVRCSYCDNPIYRLRNITKRNKNFFCSKQCENNFNIEKSNDIRICPSCKKEFNCKKHDKLIFCSVACQGIWQSLNRVGKNSSNYNHEITDDMRTKKCEYCENEMKGTPRIFVSKKFCSRSCMVNGMKKTMTHPHLLSCKIMDDNNIPHENEKSVGKYSIDCFIKNKSLGIEVMGTFWHCDPRFYETPINEFQKNSFKRDKNKQSLCSLEKINILYLWEHDLENDYKMCEKLLLKFFENNGILKDYHSMNYSLHDDELILNDKIIIQFFEK